MRREFSIVHTARPSQRAADAEQRVKRGPLDAGHRTASAYPEEERLDAASWEDLAGRLHGLLIVLEDRLAPG